MSKKLPTDKSNCNTATSEMQGKSEKDLKKIERERLKAEAAERYKTTTYHISGRFKGLPTHLSYQTKSQIRPMKHRLMRRLAKAITRGAYYNLFGQWSWVNGYISRYSAPIHDMTRISARIGRDVEAYARVAEALTKATNKH
jgi:hypothetical protein